MAEDDVTTTEEGEGAGTTPDAGTEDNPTTSDTAAGTREDPIQVNAPFTQTKGGKFFEINLKTTAKQVKTANSDVETELESLKRALSGDASKRIVNSLEERDALTDMRAGDQVYVIDATADPTVEEGGALYLYMTDSTWLKIGEPAAIDLVVKWSAIQEGPTSTVEQIDDAVSKAHEHENKEVLDKFTEDESGKLLYNNKSVGDDLVWVAAVASMDEVPANLADMGIIICDPVFASK